MSMNIYTFGFLLIVSNGARVYAIRCWIILFITKSLYMIQLTIVAPCRRFGFLCICLLVRLISFHSVVYTVMFIQHALGQLYSNICTVCTRMDTRTIACSFLPLWKYRTPYICLRFSLRSMHSISGMYEYTSFALHAQTFMNIFPHFSFIPRVFYA